jgi:SAM-dependent methyltransferase
VDRAFNARIYTDYYHLYPFDGLETLEEHYREPFDRAFAFVAGGAAQGRSLLEIGCSDAAQLDTFVAAGFRCTGISPGAQPSPRVAMIDAFYEERTFDEQFDVVVSRFNLEHIVDLDLFLERIRGDLRPGGRLFVQVPNVRRFLDLGLLNVFAHEHTQYFCHRSLQQLLDRTGFTVSLLAGADDPSLIVAAQPLPPELGNAEILARNRSRLADLRALLDEHNGKEIVIYGAGLSVIGMLYGAGGLLDDVPGGRRMADDNPLVHGRRLPGAATSIEAFDPTTIDSDTVVVVALSPIYHARVLPRVLATGAAAIYALTSDGVERKR